MPKAILEFNLPEEQEEFSNALNGVQYKIILDDLDNWLRDKVKYDNIQNIAIEKIRQRVSQLLEERGL